MHPPTSGLTKAFSRWGRRLIKIPVCKKGQCAVGSVSETHAYVQRAYRVCVYTPTRACIHIIYI